MNTPSFPTASDAFSVTEVTKVRKSLRAVQAGAGRQRSAVALAVFAGASLLAAAIGARAARRNRSWYSVLTSWRRRW